MNLTAGGGGLSLYAKNPDRVPPAATLQMIDSTIKSQVRSILADPWSSLPGLFFLDRPSADPSLPVRDRFCRLNISIEEKKNTADEIVTIQYNLPKEIKFPSGEKWTLLFGA